MSKVYQPFIIEKAHLIMEVLQDDIECDEYVQNRICDMLTDKFIKGDLSSEDPINSIFEKEELLSFINECVVREDLNRLIKQGLVGCYEDEKEGNLYFLTEKGKEYVKNLMDI